MTFTRETASALEAIVSAVQEIRSATPNTELTETSPGSVGETDVANLVGCSRQNIRKLMLTHSATFPPVVHEGTQNLWHLCPVLD